MYKAIRSNPNSYMI